jgi:hypothetical protein
MPPIDEPATFEPKTPAAEGRKPKTTASASDQPGGADLFAVTVEAGAGRILKIERVDGSGARHEISEEERGRLVRIQAKATLERLIEQAFEAGIDCVLGAGEKQPPESNEDAELSRALLRSLIARSPARRLIEGDLLNQAIVGSLIEHAAGLRAATSESAVAH